MKTIISLDYKHKFFQKRASDCYLQGTLYSYTGNTGNKSSLVN